MCVDTSGDLADVVESERTNGVDVHHHLHGQH